jgi:predicted SAM-dependent methyltransferase
MRKLVLGSGRPPLHPFHHQFVDDTYTLVDKYIDHPDVMQMDVMQMDLPDHSCSDIYASHVLEHLPDTERALIEWHRVLIPSGRLRIFVPDLLWACRYLAKLEEDPSNADPRCAPYYLNTESVLKIIFGSQAHEGEFHHTGFTQKLLKSKLENTGFQVLDICSRFTDHHMQSLYAEASATKVTL